MCFLLLQSGMLVSAIGLWGQNEIVRSDSAQLLRKVWMQRGSVAGGDRVGEGAGSVGDINGDSIMDLAWYFGRTGQWWIHLGSDEGISTAPYQVFDGLGANPKHPLWGNFYGDGSLHVMFPDGYIADSEKGWVSAEYPLFSVQGDTISQIPRAVLQPTRTAWPDMTGTPQFYFAVDLNKDGNDELVAVVSVLTRARVRDTRAEVWIFAGGPEFSLDRPTVVLKDDQENDGTLYAAVGDLDGDSYPEIIIGGIYKEAPRNQLKFWRGASSITSLSASPNRTLDLDATELTLPPTSPVFLDVDGDSALDIVGNRLPDVSSDRWQINLYSSRSGRSVWDRTFSEGDAQRIYRTTGLYAGGSLGYINDSGRRYAMLGLFGPGGSGGAGVYGLSGGADGPNSTYDGYYSAADDGMIAGSVFGVGGPVGDATGDGWDDYLTGNPQWYGQDQGIVLLLSGGPYIPTDDPTVSVREAPVAGEAVGLSLWPNPVVEELHIAWKGNLRKMPDRLVVYDAAGRLVVEGEVEGWRGSAIWRCGSVASGTYLLVVFDETGEVIATARVVKE